jgi:hypothetical protein
MSITIDLPPDVHEALSAEAQRLNLPLSEYALRVLLAHKPATTTPRNGAELVEYWRAQGPVGTRPEITDGPVHARQIRTEAERRARV